MPSIKISIKHGIGQSEAASRIKRFLNTSVQTLPSQISDLKINWDGANSNFYFRVGNFKINGKLVVSNDCISLDSNLPFIFFPLKGQIEKMVRKHAETVLL